MDQQWQPYSDVTGSRQARYTQSNAQQQTRDTSNGLAQHQAPPSGFSYEAYQTPSLPSHPQSMATSPIGTPHSRAYSGDGDVAMEDADPYNRMKYPSRPNHQHRSSGQYVKQEDSSAARRYSPMKALSPSSQYATSPQQPNPGSYGSYSSQNVSARQSPTRSNPYATPSQTYYTTPSESSKLQSDSHRSPETDTNTPILAARQHPLHLPPIQPGEASPDQYYPNSATAQLNAVFGREAKSPRHLRPPRSASTLDMPRGPVPRFRKLEKIQDLEPKINPQPAFRRANPEGGFISVRVPDLVLGRCGILQRCSPCKH